MAEIAIALPFKISALGVVDTTERQEKIWADRVRGVIGTTFRERIMRPEFGSALVESLFESADDAILDIRTQVDNAFDDFLPSLTLVDVIIDEQPESGTMNLEIVYQLPNEREVTTIIGYIQVDGTAYPLQELLSYQEIPNE